ncbi:MAG: hypothetical protein C0594_02865, partial [Marinilabiliales bacterium]
MKSKLEVTPIAAVNSMNESDMLSSSKSSGISDQNIRAMGFEFAEVELAEVTSPDIVLDAAKKDAEQISDDAKYTFKESVQAYKFAERKNNEANKAQSDADFAFIEAEKAVDETQKKELLKKATQLQEDADRLKKQAVTAFNIANNLDQVAKEKQKLADETSNLAENMSSEDKTAEELVSDLNTNRENVMANDKKLTSIDEELAVRKTELEKTNKELEDYKTNSLQTKSELNSLQDEIKTIKDRINESPEGDSEYEQILNTKLDEYKSKNEEYAEAVKQQKQAELEVNNLNDEIAFLNELTENVEKDTSNIEDLENSYDELVSEDLKNDIFNKDLEADEGFAKTVVNTEQEVLAEADDFVKEIEADIASDNKNSETSDIAENVDNSDNQEAIVEENTSENSEVLADNTENNDNVQDTPPSNSEEEEPNTEEVKDNTSNETVTEDIEEITTESYESEDANKLLQEAKNDQQVAQGLLNAASQKETELSSISDEDKKTALQTEIREMKDLANYKIEQAKQKSEQAKQAEDQYLAQNVSNTDNTVPENNQEVSETAEVRDTSTVVEEIKVEEDTSPVDVAEDNVYFANADENETPEIQFEKQLFNAKYYENLAQEQKQKVEIMQRGADTISDSNTKKAISKEIENLMKQVAQNKELANQSYKNADALKKQYSGQIANTDISPAELTLKASVYVPKNDLPITDDDKKEIRSARVNRSNATPTFEEFSNLNKELSNLKQAEENTRKKKEKEELQKQIDEVVKQAEEKFNNYNQIVELANKTEYKAYQKSLDNNRVIAEDNKVKTAYNLEKEANIFYEKANFSRQNSMFIEDFKERTDELLLAKNLELTAIEKQKHALDLYTEAQEEGVGTVEIASQETEAGRKAELTLLTEEEEQIKEYRGLLDKASKQEKEAENDYSAASNMLEEAKNLYSEKEKDKLIKDATADKKRATDILLKAYDNHHKADSIKYNLYKNQLEQLKESLTKVENNDLVANQYLKEAEFYYTEAKNIRKQADTIQNTDDQVKLLRKAKILEKQALTSQEIALDVLIEPDPVTFTVNNELVIVDRLQAMNQPIDVSMVERYREAKIIEKLDLDELDLKALDEANMIYKEAERNLSTVDMIEEDIKALNDIINSSASKKEKKKASKQLNRLSKEKWDYQFAAMENYENANDYKYWVYKENLEKVRTPGNSDKARMGRQLEKEADKHYREAKRLRDKAFYVETDKESYDLMYEASLLEEKALENNQKAYGMYLDLPSITEDSAMLASKYNETSPGISEDNIIKTTADITPLTNPNDTTNLSDNTNDVTYNEETDEGPESENIESGTIIFYDDTPIDNSPEDETEDTSDVVSNEIIPTADTTKIESPETELLAENTNPEENNEPEVETETVTEPETETSDVNNNEITETETVTEPETETETETEIVAEPETETSDINSNEITEVETEITENNTSEEPSISTTNFDDASIKEIAELLIARGYGYSFNPDIQYSENNPI